MSSLPEITLLGANDVVQLQKNFAAKTNISRPRMQNHSVEQQKRYQLDSEFSTNPPFSAAQEQSFYHTPQTVRNEHLLLHNNAELLFCIEHHSYQGLQGTQRVTSTTLQHTVN